MRILTLPAYSEQKKKSCKAVHEYKSSEITWAYRKQGSNTHAGIAPVEEVQTHLDVF